MNLVKSVKIGGILVFFQSYEYLNICYKEWTEQKIIGNLELVKETIFDLKYCKNKNEERIKKAKISNNLLLFTVYRGKNSEGINFPNDEARMVICIGMPYPNLSDIKVKLKKDFLDEKYKKEKKGYNGWQWYREEAMVAVNQSLGRLIRNKDDFGIMICFGIEFEINKNLFSNWIKKNMSYRSENDNKYYQKLENFFINLNKVNINSISEKNINNYCEEGNDLDNENEKEENDYEDEENEYEKKENDYENEKGENVYDDDKNKYEKKENNYENGKNEYEKKEINYKDEEK